MTSAGHGAAAWIATFRLDTSYLSRISAGNLSILMNIVGTHWLCVARYSSTRLSASSGSKWSMNTTVPPTELVTPQKRSGAA
ncbi:Uncharacterised protein [Mycobacteroides abscessus subsp. abscessus]|nr:Uncharacterised protein [Mycobacteroides abscessus subsp. abscessus]